MLEKVKDTIYNVFFRETIIINPAVSLEGRVVLLTGGTKGIGESIAKVLKSQGASVCVISRQASKSNGDFYSADVSKPDQIKKAVQKIESKFGKVDVLINNAGVFTQKKLTDFSQKDIDTVIDTNIKGVIFVTQTVLPLLKKSDRGLIINIGSQISRNSQIEAGRSLYAASKFALEGFSRALSKELIEERIRVTCVMPSTVKTFRNFSPTKYISPFIVADLVRHLITQKNAGYESIVLRPAN